MSNKVKMPERYHQHARELKRELDLAHATHLGRKSRHEEDPEGSQRWIETGRWEKSD